MERKDDGGEAFPLPYFAQGIDLIGGRPGMSLRQWYAGQALIGLLAATANRSEMPDPSGIARHAHIYADAMIEARKQ